MFGSWQFFRDPSQGRYQGPALTSEPVREEIHPWDQVLHLTPFTYLIEGVVSVCGGVGQGGTEQSLEEERWQEAGL